VHPLRDSAGPGWAAIIRHKHFPPPATACDRSKLTNPFPPILPEVVTAVTHTGTEPLASAHTKRLHGTTLKPARIKGDVHRYVVPEQSALLSLEERPSRPGCPGNCLGPALHSRRNALILGTSPMADPHHLPDDHSRYKRLALRHGTSKTSRSERLGAPGATGDAETSRPFDQRPARSHETYALPAAIAHSVGRRPRRRGASMRAHAAIPAPYARRKRDRCRYRERKPLSPFAVHRGLGAPHPPCLPPISIRCPFSKSCQ